MLRNRWRVIRFYTTKKVFDQKFQHYKNIFPSYEEKFQIRFFTPFPIKKGQWISTFWECLFRKNKYIHILKCFIRLFSPESITKKWICAFFLFSFFSLQKQSNKKQTKNKWLQQNAPSSFPHSRYSCLSIRS